MKTHRLRYGVTFAPKSDLVSWVVYERPKDYPEHYVARLFHWAEPTETFFLAKSLGEIRALIPVGLYRIPRSENDEPQIVEMWM